MVGMAELSKGEIAWLCEQFKTIEKMSLGFIEMSSAKINIKSPINDFRYVFEEYSTARTNFENAKDNKTFCLKEIPLNASDSFNTFQVHRSFYIMAMECRKALAYLGEIKSPLISNESKSELKSLREEINKISSKLEPYIEKNYIFAIDSFEDGHILGASLIVSRLIEYYLDKLKGENIEEKIQSLREKTRSDKKRDIRDFEQNLIKSSKFARNILSHNIQAIPEPEESLSLLSNCISLIKIMID